MNIFNKRKEGDNMWIIFALMSAFFAALTSILAKIGIENLIETRRGLGYIMA